ncbi:MAG: hypothetical protein JXB45_09080 [Candidatus Krumholzibacteriota bacterium]|nr:hypothetical protein [Candidatus Krumholzibacteriota bacterium]
MLMECDEFVPDIPPQAGPVNFQVLPEVESTGLYVGSTLNARKGLLRRNAEFVRAVKTAYIRGVRKGSEELRFWKEKALREASALFEGMGLSQRLLRFQIEEELLKLTVALAEKVIKHEVRADVVRCLRDQIGACLKQIEREIPIQIRLHPEDLELVEGILNAGDKSMQVLEGVRLQEDRRVQRGGCIMETQKGALKATISGQLEKLATVLEKEYASAVTEEMGSPPLRDT